RLIAAATRNVLCTDIGREGMLGGTAIGLYKDVMRRFPSCRLIASGGVSRIADIEALSNAGVPAVVFGKAIYEGRIDMNELADRCLQRE
ncbi:MAG: 1-(5-phosphoribosyl)-5-[(5-phosphoribosylamino)methylideneamino]imidazole-4-carboxamide isomerase, partial [Prevotella sp.]|nr:1-(5-phosphoribosyl)-5-[(5-phosphoribosylamino)methylideneamino]imidazole-4-carboxamide isomerase [Prevotella sp.]